MSANWAERERDTNRLVRAIADHLFERDQLAPENLYGLAKLTWITSSYEGDNPAYITSTKIPALGEALGVRFGNQSLPDVARNCRDITGSDQIEQLILRHTGFTNFYKAYRNSVRGWIDENHDDLIVLFREAYRASDRESRLGVVNRVGRMPGIPKANHPEQLMRAEYFVTPVLFSLDSDVGFPLINGNEWVRNVLAALNVTGASLMDQFVAMSEMIGQSGIVDAADLDQVGRAMGNRAVDFIRTPTKTPTKALLGKKETNLEKELPLKDESDVEVIMNSGSKLQRRKHNALTNAFRDALGEYALVEGATPECMFDVLVKNYDGSGNDLLVEAKSSTESANLRMAIGQLYHYWYSLGNDLDDTHLAVLLPHKPSEVDMGFLRAMGVGLMWVENEALQTSDEWLAHLARER